MGSAIDKLAFQPPDPSFTQANLSSKVSYTINSKGTRVSYLSFIVRFLFKKCNATSYTAVKKNNGENVFQALAI